MVKKRHTIKYLFAFILIMALVFPSFAIEGVAADHSLLKVGDRGSQVKELQSNLNDQGSNISADGIFGAATKKAVKAFQKKKRLQVDGIAGPKTLKALGGKVSGTKKPSKKTQKKKQSTSSLLRTGDRGSSVKSLQSSLKSHGYNVSADGIFGPATAKAVRSFQSSKGLQVDGIAGSMTLAALNKTGTSGTDDNKTKPPKETTGNNGIVSTAESLIGTPYVWGGTTKAGFDSSGFINYVFKQAGINLNRTHADMWAANGQKVGTPQVGDVVFFEGTYKEGISHSGIYVGNGEMIHAGTEKTGVEKTSMEIGYWSDRYIGAKSM